MWCTLEWSNWDSTFKISQARGSASAAGQAVIPVLQILLTATDRGWLCGMYTNQHPRSAWSGPQESYYANLLLASAMLLLQGTPKPCLSFLHTNPFPNQQAMLIRYKQNTKTAATSLCEISQIGNAAPAASWWPPRCSWLVTHLQMLCQPSYMVSITITIIILNIVDLLRPFYELYNQAMYIVPVNCHKQLTTRDRYVVSY